MVRIVSTLVVCIGLACSGGSSSDGGGLCNGAACAATEYCIHPCCGGSPVCTPIPDGGVCPDGTVQLANCPPTAAPGCQQLCDSPAPYCSATLPTGCSIDSRTGEVACICA